MSNSPWIQSGYGGYGGYSGYSEPKVVTVTTLGCWLCGGCTCAYLSFSDDLKSSKHMNMFLTCADLRRHRIDS